MSLNKVLLIGNAGRDPEIRHLESGTMNATFSLATTERYRDRSTGEMKEQTEWHNIVCWRNLAEIAEKYVKKGTQLFIEGRIRTRSYNDKDGNTKYMTEILADNMQLLGRKADNPGNQGGGYSQGGGYQQPYLSAPAAGRMAAAPAEFPATAAELAAASAAAPGVQYPRTDSPRRRLLRRRRGGRRSPVLEHCPETEEIS